MKKNESAECLCVCAFVCAVELYEFVGKIVVTTCFRILCVLPHATIIFSIVHLFSASKFSKLWSIVRFIFIGRQNFVPFYFKARDGLKHFSISLLLFIYVHLPHQFYGLSTQNAHSYPSIRTFIYTNVNYVFPFRFVCRFLYEIQRESKHSEVRLFYIH